MNRVIPIGPKFIEPGHQQPVTFDHHLRIARLHREDEIVVIVLARDTREFQRALDHPKRRIAESIHDSVAERSVVGSDTHRAAKFLANFDKWRGALLDPAQLRCVLLVAVFLDGELLRVRVVARIDPHLLDPLRRFQRSIRFEMNICDNRDHAPARAQFCNNILQIRGVLDGRRRDAHQLTAHLDQLERLLHAQRRIHRVAREHRLDDNRMVTANDYPASRRVAHNHFATFAPLEEIG